VVVVIASHKFFWLPGIVFAVLEARQNRLLEAGVVATVSVLLGLFLLRPVRLRTAGSVVSLGVLRRGRWEWWDSDQVSAIQYAHWPGMLRATASLRFITNDGTTVSLPGTTGRMLWRSPELESPAIPQRRFRLVLTVGLLRLVRNSFGRPIDTEGAEWLSSARPE
jgi:hypothetical protein